MAVRRCGTQGRVIGCGFKQRPLEPHGLAGARKLDGHGSGGLAGDGQAQGLVKILAELVTVIDHPLFDGLCKLLAQQLGFLGVAGLGGLAPEAVHAHAQGLLGDSGPAMLMVYQVGEEGHDFNRLLTWRVWVPAFTCQVLAGDCLASKQGHGKDEMHMETCVAGFGVWFFTVQHEQAIELVAGKAGCHHGFETVNDGEQFGLGRLLAGAEGQATTGVFVLTADAVDEVNGQPGRAFKQFRRVLTEVAFVVTSAEKVVHG